VFLDQLAEEAPTRQEPFTTPAISPAERQTCFEAQVKYIERVKGQLGNTHRGMSASAILNMAEVEAEAEVRTLPIADPKIILEVRRFLIADHQCSRLVNFLKHQKVEVESDIRGMRSDLIQSSQRRNPA
jgi:hypothetical protein